jgi:hypothetical protein
MTPSPESPIAPAADPANDSGVDLTLEDTRTFPGRVRGQRLEITPADLTMYSVITGRAPSREERERALTWSDADPMHEEIAGIAPAAAAAVLPAGYAARPWHPAALSLWVRDVWFNGLTIKMNRPQISGWVRRVSLALQQGKRRVQKPSR